MFDLEELKKHIIEIKDEEIRISVDEYFAPCYINLFNPKTNLPAKEDIKNDRSLIDFSHINHSIFNVFCESLQILEQDNLHVIFCTDGYFGMGVYRIKKTILCNKEGPLQLPVFLWVSLLQKVVLHQVQTTHNLEHYRQVLTYGKTADNPIFFDDEKFILDGDTQYFKSADGLPLFDPTTLIPQTFDILQYRIGCCYIDGSLMAIVERNPELIKQLFFKDTKDHVIVMLYEKDNKKIFYRLQKTILFDEHGAIQKHRFLWVHMLEKALAIHYKNIDIFNYIKSLTGGGCLDVLKHCLGHQLQNEHILLCDFINIDPQTVKQRLCSLINDSKTIISVCTKDHAYSLKFLIDRNKDTFVAVGNPHGHAGRNHFSGFELFSLDEFLKKFYSIVIAITQHPPAAPPPSTIDLYKEQTFSYHFSLSVFRKLPEWQFIMPTESNRAIIMIAEQLSSHPSLMSIDLATSQVLQKNLLKMLQHCCYRKHHLTLFLPHNMQINNEGQYCTYGIHFSNDRGLDRRLSTDLIESVIRQSLLTTHIPRQDPIPGIIAPSFGFFPI